MRGSVSFGRRRRRRWRTLNFIYHMTGSVCASVLFTNRASTAMQCTGEAILRIGCGLII